LLENGADPNIAARSDEGLLHPSVLAEYITSNGNKDKLSHDVVDLLLRHGAQVSISFPKLREKRKLIIIVCFRWSSRHNTVILWDCILSYRLWPSTHGSF
jgi:hypothetical protein